MGVERLQLLFRSCNASGLLPFRIVLDAQTKRFKRFENQWCHPTNWWFLIVLIGQSFFVYFIIDYLRWIIFEEFESKLTVFSAIFILGMLNYVVLCLSLRLFLFRFRHLENAMEIFHKVDRLLTKSFRAAPCHARQRTFIGLTLNFIGIVGLNLVQIPALSNMMDRIGLIGTVVQLVVSSIISFQLGSWLLLVHLSYYSLSYRIRLLTSFIAPTKIVRTKMDNLPWSSTLPSLNSNQMKRQLRTCAYIFDKLCLTAKELNATFSLSVLINLTINIIISACSLFFCIFAYSSVVQDMIYSFGLLFVSSVAIILVILYSAELPIFEIKRLREQILKISSDDDLDTNILIEATACLTTSSFDRIQLRAGGLFVIGTQLIPSWISAVITYLVIFLQSATTENSILNQDESRIQNISTHFN